VAVDSARFAAVTAWSGTYAPVRARDIGTELAASTAPSVLVAGSTLSVDLTAEGIHEEYAVISLVDPVSGRSRRCGTARCVRAAGR